LIKIKLPIRSQSRK